jgi:hypothetical protein
MNCASKLIPESDDIDRLCTGSDEFNLEAGRYGDGDPKGDEMEDGMEVDGMCNRSIEFNFEAGRYGDEDPKGDETDDGMEVGLVAGDPKKSGWMNGREAGLVITSISGTLEVTVSQIWDAQWFHTLNCQTELRGYPLETEVWGLAHKCDCYDPISTWIPWAYQCPT